MKRLYYKILAGTISILMVLSLSVSALAVSAEKNLSPLNTSSYIYYGEGEGILTPTEAFNKYSEACAVIYEGVKNLNEEINVEEYNILKTDVGSILSSIETIYPDLFYIDTRSSSSYANSDCILTVNFTFKFDKSEIPQMQEKFYNEVDRILSTIITDDMKDIDKLLALHDYIAVSTEYDMGVYDGTESISAYSAYGALIDHNAVCQGYSYAYMYLLSKEGIFSTLCKSSAMGHAWNYVELDGEFYHVDVTHDDPVGADIGNVYHTNFLKSDAYFLNDNDHHDWSVDFICDDTSYDSGNFYDGVRSSIIPINGKFYYLKIDTENHGNSSLMEYDSENDFQTILCDVESRWFTPENEYYYSTSYSRLANFDSTLYYNTANAVYSISISGENNKLIYNLPDDAVNTQIFGLEAREDGIYIATSTEPGSANPSIYRICDTNGSNVVEDIYSEIYDAIIICEDQINVSKYNMLPNDMNSIISAIPDRYPNIFYLDAVRYNILQNTGIVQNIQFIYKYENDEILEMQEEFNNAVDEMLSHVTSDMNDHEKLLVLHDLLVNNVSYDMDVYVPGATVSNLSRTAYGALVNNIAVCEGYTYAYKYLLSKLGIFSDICISKEMNHSWNYVKLNGKYYHVDITQDDPIINNIGAVSHEYFLRSDTFFQNHSHGGWSQNYVCSDTSYDSGMFYDEAISFIIPIDGCYYYIKNTDIIGDVCLVKYDYTSDTKTIIKDISSKWYQTDSSSGYWSESFTNLSKLGSILYYNTSSSVYSIDTNGENNTLVYRISDTANYLKIFGIESRKDGIYISVASSPNAEKSEVLKVVNSDGTPIYDVDVPVLSYEDYEYTVDNFEITLTKYNGTDKIVVLPPLIDGMRVVKIGNLCFSNTDVETIYFQPSITKAEDSAFENCLSLKTVVFYEPSDAQRASTNGLTLALGDRVFFGCSAIEELTFPSYITKIGSLAAANCSSLKKATISSTDVKIGDYAFGYSIDGESIEKIPDFTIIGSLNSTAKEYCELNEIEFKSNEDSGTLGDVDNDGNINATDAIMVLQFYAGIISDIPVDIANVNKSTTDDMTIDATDAILILQYYAGIITSF